MTTPPTARLDIAEMPAAPRSPRPRLPHLDDPDFDTRRIGEPDGEVPAADIYVFADVLAELRYRSVWAPDESSACLLTGGWYLGPDGPYIEIDGFRDAVRIESTVGWLNQLRAHPELLEPTRRHPDTAAGGLAVPDFELIVGFGLLRPDSQGRLAPDDLIALNSFFPQPWQTALVVDPAAGAMGFYLRDGAGKLVNAPFYLVGEPGAARVEEPHTGA